VTDKEMPAFSMVKHSNILLENLKVDVGMSGMHVYVTARNCRRVTRCTGVNFKLHPRK
jgi:hypothetical protein